MVDATARALLALWEWAGDSGQMNPKTAQSVRNSCQRILRLDRNWEDQDIRQLDVETTVQRFRGQHEGELAEVTLETYESQFRRAVRSFREYVEDPTGWRPPKEWRRSGDTRAPAGEDISVGSTGPSSSCAPEASSSLHGLVDIPIWLPSGSSAHLWLPEKCTSADVELLLSVIPAYVKAVRREDGPQ